MAGFAAENVLQKRVQPFYWPEIQELTKEDYLLDVRTVEEFGKGSIPGAVNIPLDEMRHRLNEIPTDKTVYLFCQVGMRGYLASRILMQHGFEDVRSLSGGYRLWDACTTEKDLLRVEELV